MDDTARKMTDKKLAELERRVRLVYADAQKDLQAKMDDFTRRFTTKDAIYQKKLSDGEITPAQYQRWLSGQVFQGKQWQAKLDQISDTLRRSDEVAQGIINDKVNGIFAANANWQSYTLEHGAGINFGFEVYDSSTVARLLRDEPQLLPKYKVNVPKDQLWNQKAITRQITQGILQGESLDKVAKRIAGVTDQDKNLSLTRARTAMTGAQNAGRQESLNRARQMGLKVKKEWMATLDAHTRTQHAGLDGQKVDVDKPFHYQGYRIMFPGDPKAHPAMVYNCRCTMIGDLEEYPDEYNTERYDNIDGKPIKDMTYGQWLEAKTALSKPEYTRRPVPEGTPVTLAKYDAKRARYMKSNAERYSVLDEEQTDELEQKLGEMFDKGSYYMNMDAGNLESVFNSHFMNQMEAEAKFGPLTDYDRNPSKARTKYAQSLFGSPIKDMQPEDFEKYGYLGNSNWADTLDARKNSVMINPYGKTVIRFDKDRLNGRTTYTSHDSASSVRQNLSMAGMVRNGRVDISGMNAGLKSRWVAEDAPIEKKYIGSSLKSYYETLHDASEDDLADVYGIVNKNQFGIYSSYMELQFHGELTIDDVESICFSSLEEAGKVPDRIIKSMKDMGIDLKVLKEGKIVDY